MWILCSSTILMNCRIAQKILIARRQCLVQGSFVIILLNYLFFFYNFYQMKSFQDWLDCQLYLSHLKNLTKIKEKPINLPLNNNFIRSAKTAKGYRNISTEFISSPKGKNKNAKYDMRETQIMNQNLNLASRLLNVPSVISKQKQVESYQKYQLLFKKHNNSNKFNQYRQQRLRKFLEKNEEKYIHGYHSFIVKIRFLSIPRVPESNSPVLWFELFSVAQKICSPHYSLHDILIHEVKMPFKTKVSKDMMIKLHCSRGLEYLNLGEYKFHINSQQSYQEYQDLVSENDPRKLLTLLVCLKRVKSHSKHKSLHMR